MVKGKILVTGIGGNVGQGIIRNIRAVYPGIHITGVNITAFSAGNHLCDAFYTVPYAYAEDYTKSMQEICDRENIQLIIPSTDYEVYYLAVNRAHFSAVIAGSDKLTSGIYLDKYLTWKHHSQKKIPFAVSLLPSDYNGEFERAIAKPRKGRGSRGLIIDPKKWDNLTDDEYMIQERHEGQEITTAFYVDRKKNLHGFITMQRFLENGATTQCKVVSEYDVVIRPILEAMIANGNFSGAANLQSIVCADGSIQPFEVNCRISGTNSIRSNFGFEDVKYTVQEYLLNEQPDTPVILEGVAVRILMDVIYAGQKDFIACRDNSTAFKIF